MKLIRYFNERVRTLSIFDIKLAQGAAMGVALIIVKLFPQLTQIDMVWVVVAVVILGARPTYAFYLKK